MKIGQAPRKQKGAMAYDGPNKERSEAADRVLAKTAAKRAKMKEEVEQINELKTKTMLNYIDKASDSASKQLDKANKTTSRKKEVKARLKMDSRERGIEMAKDKIMKRVKKESVDLFDLVKGRLIDEGCDEEEALKIMANISQEDFDKLKEDITLTKGDYGSRNTKGSAYNTAKSKGFKGYKAGGGLGADFLPRV